MQFISSKTFRFLFIGALCGMLSLFIHSVTRAQAGYMRLQQASSGGGGAGAAAGRGYTYSITGCNGKDAGPNDVVDDQPAIQSCVDFAQDAGGGTVLIPCGTYYVTGGPIHLRNNVILRGEGECSVLYNPNSYGPVVFNSGDYTASIGWQHGAALYDGGLSSLFMVGDGGANDRWVNLTYTGSFEYNGLADMTVESFYKTTLGPAGGASYSIFGIGGRDAPVTGGNGTRRDIVLYGIANDTDIYPNVSVTTDGGSFTLGYFKAACKFPRDHPHHVAMSWSTTGGSDGGAYLFVDGVLCDEKYGSDTSPSTIAAGKINGAVASPIKMSPWMEATLGAMPQDIPDSTGYRSAFVGYVDGLRVSRRQKYTPTSPPVRVNEAALFIPCFDDARCYTNYQSDAWFDFDNDFHEFIKFQCGGGTGGSVKTCFMPIEGSQAQNGLHGGLSDLKIRSTDGFGIPYMTQGTLHNYHSNLHTFGGYAGIYTHDNSYKNVWENILVESASNFGIVNAVAGGFNLWNYVLVTGGKFPVLLTQTSGAWNNLAITSTNGTLIPLTIKDSANTSNLTMTSVFFESEGAGATNFGREDSFGGGKAGCGWFANWGYLVLNGIDCNLAAHPDIPGFFVEEGDSITLNGGNFSMDSNSDAGTNYVFAFDNADTKPRLGIALNNFKRRPGASLLNEWSDSTNAPYIHYATPRTGTATVLNGTSSIAVSLSTPSASAGDEPDARYKIILTPKLQTCPLAAVTSRSTSSFTITTASATGTACDYDWMLTR